jgi:hypothetical protein
LGSWRRLSSQYEPPTNLLSVQGEEMLASTLRPRASGAGSKERLTRGGPRQKGELRVAGSRLALRLSELASALAQEKGETLVVGWRETED